MQLSQATILFFAAACGLPSVTLAWKVPCGHWHNRGICIKPLFNEQGKITRYNLKQDLEHINGFYFKPCPLSDYQNWCCATGEFDPPLNQVDGNTFMADTVEKPCRGPQRLVQS
ncbi:hypothetical protein Pst134EA_028962 [Puccinia striiformis f. sp. tritici]|uniref:hypothetical protein n=1 Tax=Puccinia striiformis f. sp. tritici TaxID=168172 RepID=UPI0020084082|nr:hypothetical protein Pst134EA_028962 [Puccinia striiformis f. sp. tritici]KAH9441013.1 hypothetical protein Pst134EB_029665 [Puccinia striiformis f. sp. tritici]KAH9446977.1 hypothetical protein Pst134EA_028962 [Puccinia striiformis f. sp. tritici]KAI9617294.1 hypothetical protein H4Q26_013163 [Puccinia striiformis f. sp. tritici PST-130]KAI9623349.1 hypothetical protein H4Q26_014514 [Puccinia striiformis f. sp. tritici PST-130]